MQEMPEIEVPIMSRIPCSLDRIPDGPAKDRLTDIRDEFYEALEFPNEWLPRKLRDKKNKRRSIRFLQKVAEKKQKRVSERDVTKSEKEQRIPDYRHQVTSVEFTCPDAFRNESVPGIRYREDEQRVYNAHLRFCRILGLVTQEDIDNQ